ncbi:hypothetical protein ACXJJ3_20260 [Kribbella sp. WER1]
MGQFNGYLESGEPPPSLWRAILIIGSCAAIVNAIFNRQLDDILIAVLLAVQCLPAGITPRRHRAALDALDRRPVLKFATLWTVGTCWFFVMLSQTLSRTTSLYLAVPTALTLTTASAVLRYRRLRAMPS